MNVRKTRVSRSVAQINASHLNAKLIDETGVSRMVRWVGSVTKRWLCPPSGKLVCVCVCEHLES